MKTSRNSNLELLRIISMFLIIFCHATKWGGEFILQKYGNNIPLSTFICVTKYFGEIGNAMFIFITGYFLPTFKFSFKKILRLSIEVTAYVIMILVVLVSLQRYNFTAIEYVSSVFSVFSIQYWFITAYIIFCFLAPVYKKMFKICSKNQILFYLLLLGAFCLIMQLGVFDFFGIRLIGFIELALIGAFVNQYPAKWHKNVKLNLLLALIWFAVLTTIVVFLQLAHLNGTASHDGYFFCRFYSLAVWPFCLMIFLAFKNINMKPNKTINWVASSTFFIYVIHENYLYRSSALLEIYDAVYDQTMSTFVLFSIILTFVEFLVSLAVDKICQSTIFRPINKMRNNNFFSKIDKKMNQE